MVTESYSFFFRSDGVLPEGLAEVVCTLTCATSGEPHERRMKVCQCLHQVLAERAVLAVLPQLRCLGQQGYIIQPEGTGLIGYDREAAVNRALGLELAGVFMPVFIQVVYGDGV